MALADTFQEIVDSLPDDWTDLELDLRIFDETRYVDGRVYLGHGQRAAVLEHDWHWRILVAHRFGHAAAAPAVHGALKLLDDAGLEGELAVREVAQRPGRGRADVGPARVGAPGVQAHPRPVTPPFSRSGRP